MNLSGNAMANPIDPNSTIRRIISFLRNKELSLPSPHHHSQPLLFQFLHLSLEKHLFQPEIVEMDGVTSSLVTLSRFVKERMLICPRV